MVFEMKNKLLALFNANNLLKIMFNMQNPKLIEKF